MPHKIEISDKTYELLKDFCTLNKLKIGQYTDKLIYDALMIEMYGDVPFMDYRKKMLKEFPVEQFEKEYLQQPDPITVDETEHTKDAMIEVMEKFEAEHPQAYITSQEGEKEIQKEMLKQIGTISASDIEEYVAESKKMQEAVLKQAGVPAKVINKITKRRLK